MTTDSLELVKAGNEDNTGTITTASMEGNGILSPEQSQRFLVTVKDKMTISPIVRHELRKAPSGRIDKISIGDLMIEPFIEDSPDDYNARPEYSHVPYAVNEAWLPWSVTNETLRENIEGSTYEQTVETLMTNQLASDLENVLLNGDTEHEIKTRKDKILAQDNGWIKQMKGEGGHHLDGSGVTELNLDVWGQMAQELPSKYTTPELTWLVNPHLFTQWMLYLNNNAVTAGGIVSDFYVQNPCGFKIVPSSHVPDDTIILTVPRNLIMIHTYDLQIKKTDQGYTALRHNATYYAERFNYDAVIQELDATVIMTGIPRNIYSFGKAAAVATRKAPQAKAS